MFINENKLIHFSHDTDDAACNREVFLVVHDNRFVLRVCRTQFNVVGTRMVVLDRCFVIDLRDDDFAEVGCLLLARENQVAVENACVNHGIALDAESEDIATAGEEVTVDGDCAFEVLHGENRRTGGNATDDRNLDDVACGLLARIAFVGIQNLDTAAEARGAVDVAFLDEGCENGTYAVRGRNVEVVADFADRRRHVVFFGILLDVFVDFFLPCRHFFAFFIKVFHLGPLVIKDSGIAMYKI